MKRLHGIVLAFAIVVSSANACGGAITPQAGIATAQMLLDILSTILGPAVETTKALCGVRTQEDYPRHAEARFECAKVNDAWTNAVAAEADLKNSLESGDQNRIERSTNALEKAVNELKGVLRGITAVKP